MDIITYFPFILMSLGLLLGPTAILVVIGLRKRRAKSDSSTVYFILAVVYLLISGSICSTLIF